ncbi:MAG: hypothetical protein LCH95_00625 [Proteobacteria bacterium]|nr:hypothetical protein [Pseudomonadota bacterium]
MTRRRLSLLFLVASLPAPPVLAAAPDSSYMRPDRYPAQVTAIDFGSRRVTFTQPILLAGWQVSLRPDAAAEWQDNFRPNGLRNRRGVWIPARCRADADAAGRRCGFWFTQVVGMSRPEPSCALAVFDPATRRWERSQIACASAVSLEPAAPSGDPRLGPPGTRPGRRS